MADKKVLGDDSDCEGVPAPSPAVPAKNATPMDLISDDEAEIPCIVQTSQQDAQKSQLEAKPLVAKMSPDVISDDEMLSTKNGSEDRRKEQRDEAEKTAADLGSVEQVPRSAVPLDVAEPSDVAGKSGVTALSDSEEEAPSKRPKEYTFGADLEAELRREHRVSLEEEENDAERLPRETEPYPLLPASAENADSVSAAAKKVLNKTKQEAQVALEQGNLKQALDKYTRAIRSGGASALLLATRGQLLLKLRRPLAAVRDCTVALKINPNLIKAYRIRGTSHRKLGHWRRSHRDLSQAQKLEFDNDIAATHKVVASKLGLVQDARTGVWTKREGAQKAMDLEKARNQELKQGQAVRVEGLKKAPQLNGLRGIVQRRVPGEEPRWEVEMRLDEGRLEVKAIRAENIVPLKADEKQDWKEREKKHAEERKKREAEERRQKEEEERVARRKAVERRLKQDGIPDMDPSELVEAEMSGMSLNESLCRMLRRLEPDQALEILWHVQASRVNDMPALLRERVKQALGEDEEDDDEEDDPERLQEETIPLPPLPDDLEAEPLNDEDAQYVQFATKAATQALEIGDLGRALQKYTEAIECGGASALLLAKRAELLLGQKRPCAAVRDCTAALEINPDSGKAFRIRGVAHRKLGNWREALSDLTQGQALDFDEATTVVQAFVAKKAKALEEREAARRRGAKRARLG